MSKPLSKISPLDLRDPLSRSWAEHVFSKFLEGIKKSEVPEIENTETEYSLSWSNVDRNFLDFSQEEKKNFEKLVPGFKIFSATYGNNGSEGDYSDTTAFSAKISPGHEGSLVFDMFLSRPPYCDQDIDASLAVDVYLAKNEKDLINVENFIKEQTARGAAATALNFTAKFSPLEQAAFLECVLDKLGVEKKAKEKILHIVGSQELKKEDFSR